MPYFDHFPFSKESLSGQGRLGLLGIYAEPQHLFDQANNRQRIGISIVMAQMSFAGGGHHEHGVEHQQSHHQPRGRRYQHYGQTHKHRGLKVDSFLALVLDKGVLPLRGQPFDQREDEKG
jgi:hypothetical protein